MKKKIFIAVYLTGLFIGIIGFNYMLYYYRDSADLLAQSLTKIDKLFNINQKELYLYLFFKRMKQAAILFLLYFHIPERILIVLMGMYMTIAEGFIFSLCTYYYGIIGTLTGAVLLIVPVVLFVLLVIIIKKLCDKKKQIQYIDGIKVLFVLCILIIMACVLEISVNNAFVGRFFANK